MNKFKKTFFMSLILMFASQTSVLSLDYSDFGSFQDRSEIMKMLNGNKETKISKEQTEILRSKKLSLTAECLFREIKKNNIENVNLLLEFNLSPNASLMSDYPIRYATKLNRTEIAKLLLEKGAKLDRGFYSELYEAVRNKNKELAQLFLDNGAKINYSDSITNNSIIYLALKNDMIDIAGQLIKKGVYADRKSAILIRKKKLQYLIEDNN